MTIKINDVKSAVTGILQKHGVTKAALFGSIVSGNMTDASDIDILVTFEGEKSLFDLAALKLELEQILGRRIDLVTYGSLHPLVRDSILREQIVIL